MGAVQQGVVVAVCLWNWCVVLCCCVNAACSLDQIYVFLCTGASCDGIEEFVVLCLFDALPLLRVKCGRVLLLVNVCVCSTTGGSPGRTGFALPKRHGHGEYRPWGPDALDKMKDRVPPELLVGTSPKVRAPDRLQWLYQPFTTVALY